jgi:radical SAM superfamily enzyme YgiQ (UPF0313 family)
MKVVLVGMPISQQVHGSFTNPSVPLSIGYLAAYALQDRLIRKNVDLEILRLVLGAPDSQQQDDETILQEIMLRTPDVVAFSCYIWNIDRISHLSQMIKLVSEDITVIWGGPEVGFLAEETLAQNPSVDFVVRGEGEIAFAELIKYLFRKGLDLEKIPGIAFRENGNIMIGPEPSLVRNLDDIPSPYLGRIFNLKEGPEGNRMLLEGMRRCSFRCGYCTCPGTVRYFSLDRLRREIEFCFEQDFESFALVDPFLNTSQARLSALADILQAIDPKQKKLGPCTLIAEMLNEEMVAVLSRMNIPIGETGLQSTNPAVLRNIRRRFHPERYQRGVRLLQNAGIPVHIQIIAGLPGDTLDGLKRTLDFAISLRPDRLSCFSALLLPGSYLYEMRDRFQIRFDPRPPHRILGHYSLNYDEMLECLELGNEACIEYSWLSKNEKNLVADLDLEQFKASGNPRRLRRINTMRTPS